MNAISLKQISRALSRLMLVTLISTPILTIAQKSDAVYTTVEKSASFPGGNKGFAGYLAKNLKYPKKAVSKNITGRVFIAFVVEKDGTLTDVKVKRGIGNGCDEEAVRAIKASPKWQPGTIKGKPVREMFTVPINFALVKNNKGGIHNQSDNAPLRQVEGQASFPGGEKEFFSYLGKTIHYPKMAREKNVQGRVVLAFIVEKDGSLSDIKIRKSVGGGCDEEAVRALKNGPKWVPAKQHGQPVRAEYVLPVSFALTKA